MKYTIEDLAEGRCAVINDGTLDELREVLRRAFPKDNYETFGFFKYHYRSTFDCDQWDSSYNTVLPTQSVKDFLEEPKQQQYSMESLILQLQERAYEQGLKVEIIFKTK